MRTADILQMAYDEAPEMMKEAALCLALTERIGPQHVDEVVEEFQKIAQRVSEKTKEAMDAGAAREAAKGFGRSSMTVGKGALTIAAGTVAAGLGMAIATDLYNSARRGLTKARNERRMLDADPELKEQAKKQRARFDAHYSMFVRAAPDIAADPLVSGAYMKRVLMADQHQDIEKDYRGLVEMQKTKRDSLYDPFKGVKYQTPKKS